VMNEAVELTKQFSDDDHYKFINGVLSNIKK
ncbi:transcription antitermination factor NusB, partial [Staphylococcus aureus]|nr:N utilization substance protein B [Staphylococcus aureus]HDC8846086.1 N utilization substance protein B [Staphylococcus aureus]